MVETYSEDLLNISLIGQLITGLSMNIVRVGDKSPVQRPFFKNSVGDLLPALRFLSGLNNFVIIFSLL